MALARIAIAARREDPQRADREARYQLGTAGIRKASNRSPLNSPTRIMVASITKQRPFIAGHLCSRLRLIPFGVLPIGVEGGCRHGNSTIEGRPTPGSFAFPSHAPLASGKLCCQIRERPCDHGPWRWLPDSVASRGGRQPPPPWERESVGHSESKAQRRSSCMPYGLCGIFGRRSPRTVLASAKYMPFAVFRIVQVSRCSEAIRACGHLHWRALQVHI